MEESRSRWTPQPPTTCRPANRRAIVGVAAVAVSADADEWSSGIQGFCLGRDKAAEPKKSGGAIGAAAGLSGSVSYAALRNRRPSRATEARALPSNSSEDGSGTCGGVAVVVEEKVTVVPPVPPTGPWVVRTKVPGVGSNPVRVAVPTPTTSRVLVPALYEKVVNEVSVSVELTAPFVAV